jgi:hypothetical protein
MISTMAGAPAGPRVSYAIFIPFTSAMATSHLFRLAWQRHDDLHARMQARGMRHQAHRCSLPSRRIRRTTRLEPYTIDLVKAYSGMPYSIPILRAEVCLACPTLGDLYLLGRHDGCHDRRSTKTHRVRREIFMRKIVVATSLTIGIVGIALGQSDSIKIAYIEPLSGGGASVGDGGLKHFQFFAEQINASGGINGKKLEILALDNKTNPQESIVQAQKAIDQGARFLTRATARQLRRRSPNSRSRTMTAIPTSRFSISIMPPSTPC